MTTINWSMRARDTDLRIRNFMEGDHVSHSVDNNTIVDLGENPVTKYSPRDGRLLYTFPAGDSTDVDRAVASARQAFENGSWRTLPCYQRKAVLTTLADLVETHKEELALLECLDVGKPISSALDDIAFVVGCLKSTAEMADKLRSASGADGGNFSYQLRKPIGVVAGIVGWNYPLVLAIQKIAPALVMGNSLVLKPSEFSSLSASRLAALAIEAGVPPGVFNVVHGRGTTVGAALAHHPDVDMLTFTGSSATGKQMMIAAGQSNMKRLMLECGGKSPYIVFDDCPDDLDFIAADIVETAFPNQGERCSAGTRLLIQESIKEKLLPKIIEHTKKIIPLDPLNPDTTFGALINETQLNKVLAYIDSGKEEGAELIYGGQRVEVTTEETASQGYYLQPAIFDNVNPQQRIAQEEIFGPVLSIFTFKDEEEAIQLANNSSFGLAAYIATENLGRANRLAQSLDAGLIVIVGTASPSAGGIDLGVEPHKESGFGMEGGLAGLTAYTVSSSVHLCL